MMLVLISVLNQVQPVIVPIKTGPHLIAAVLQISIKSQIIAAAVLNWTNSFDLGLNRIHNSNIHNSPNESWFPVHR